MSGELFQRAVKLARDGRKDEARAVLKRILALNPRHEGAWLWLVDSQATEEGRIRVLEECLQMIPESQSAKRVLQMLRAKHVMGEAEQNVERFSDLAESEAEVFSLSEPSPLFSSASQISSDTASSASPFTVPLEEVSEEEYHGAANNLIAILGFDRPAFEVESPIAVDPTQPIHIKPHSSLPSDEELKDLFDMAEESPAGHTKSWLPAFSDDGVGRPRRASENIKTRPRSALEDSPTRPRPTAAELTNRPLFVQVEQSKPAKEPLLPVSGGDLAPSSFTEGWLTRKRMLALLIVGAGGLLVLLLVIAALLILG